MNAIQSPPRSDERAVLYRSPQEPVAAREVIALNPVARTLSRLVLDADGSPRLVAGQTFSLGEFAVLRPIVLSYPEYCPFEELLASHYYGSLSEENIATCREQLQIALDTHSWLEVINPLRTLISRLHFKVRDVGIGLGPIYKTGYLLQALGPNYRAIMNVPSTESPIQHLLRGFVPSGHVVTYNPTVRMLSYLAVEHELPRLVQEVDLTLMEERVLLPVLEAAPSYCLDERILASYTYGETGEEALALATRSLQDAKSDGLWDYKMRPIRNAMSRARLKVSAMGIALPSILETGYMASYVGPHLSQRDKGGRHD